MKHLKYLFYSGVIFLSGCNQQPNEKISAEHKSETKIIERDTSEKRDPIVKDTNSVKPFQNKKFPEVVDLSKLKSTDFALTLETETSKEKNAIYTPAFLFAWDEVMKTLNAPINVDDSISSALKSIIQSKSYKGSVKKGVCKTETKIENEKIIASAFFNISLPFKEKFERLKNPILFGPKRVMAFGMRKFDEKIAESVQILYYKNDNCFVIKITPTDATHEIILAKGVNLSGSLMKMIKETNGLIKRGIVDSKRPENSWKYAWSNLDELAIPVIKFNLQTNYSTLEGQKFSCNNANYFIESAIQRSAFMFDEYGAVVESEARVSTSKSFNREKPKFKKLIFNKPFLIYIKQTNSKNPYFAMKVVNAELMSAK